jgi:hypothetical protein
MQAIPANTALDKEKIIRKNGGAEEKERHLRGVF